VSTSLPIGIQKQTVKVESIALLHLFTWFYPSNYLTSIFFTFGKISKRKCECSKKKKEKEKSSFYTLFFSPSPQPSFSWLKQPLIFAASALKDEADALASKYPHTKPILLDVQRPSSESLQAMVREADIVVSLLPYDLHPVVAEACIENQRNMVTASYCSQPMQVSVVDGC
jgi:hypothetical protein